MFNLAELQAECAKRFKISPDETLQAAQDLYEKKLTTYPRTDARVLTKAVAKEIFKNLSHLKGYTPTQAFVDNILTKKQYENLAKTQYTDDSKVTDHYAIIPTGQLMELGVLSPLQRKVFDLIVRRFLSIFYPPAEYQTLKLVIGIEKESLFASAKALKSLGYLEVLGKTLEDADEEETDAAGQGEIGDNADNVNKNTKKNNTKKLLELAKTLKKGDAVSVNGFEIKEGKTSPPKRYTSGSMILAMENAGQLIEDEELRAQIKGSGIGTSATRAEIIKKLIRIGYLKLNKKTQVITPENFGEMVYEVVAMTVPALLNPKMTASWEKGLDGITNGTIDVGDYRTKLEDFIRRETIQIRDKDLTPQLAEQISKLSKKDAKALSAGRKIGVPCPVCDGEIATTPFGYGCSNYKKDGTGCKFSIGKIAGKELNDAEVTALLTDKKTPVLKDFTGKTGKPFDAALKLNEDNQIVFDFPEREPPVETNLACPRCKAHKLKKSQWYLECECGFRIRHTVAQIALSEETLQELFTTGKTKNKVSGFISKAGKPFDACLKYEKEVIQFDFDNAGETPGQNRDQASTQPLQEQGDYGQSAFYMDSAEIMQIFADTQ